MMPMSALATVFSPKQASALQAPENPMAEEKKEAKKRPHAGHGYKRTTVDHHDDGSHTVRHEHEDGVSHMSYAKADLDQLHDGLQDHLGEANPGEAEADGGNSGIEEV